MKQNGTHPVRFLVVKHLSKKKEQIIALKDCFVQYYSGLANDCTEWINEMKANCNFGWKRRRTFDHFELVKWHIAAWDKILIMIKKKGGLGLRLRLIIKSIPGVASILSVMSLSSNITPSPLCTLQKLKINQHPLFKAQASMHVINQEKIRLKLFSESALIAVVKIFTHGWCSHYDWPVIRVIDIVWLNVVADQQIVSFKIL